MPVDTRDAGGLAPHERKTSKANLLFVFADQLRGSSLACARQEAVQTPHLDRFAAEGVRLVNMVSTVPLCVPYRGSLLTGRFPLSSTVIANNVQLPPSMPSIGKSLKAAGYATGYIGKWHLTGEPASQGFVPPGEMRHGFDFWAAHNCSHQYVNGTYYRDDPEPIVLPGWEPDGQTDLAIGFLREHVAAQRGAGRPFALVLSWGPPHTPFSAPPEFEALYREEEVVLRPNVRVPENWSQIAQRDRLDPTLDPVVVLKRYLARYYAAITNLDWNFGRLMAALRELRLEGETVVVFTSDHGEMLGSHGQMHKTQPWDESAVVPFLIRYPGRLPEASVCDVPCGTPDILPTLFGLMGLEPPDGIEGQNLSNVLAGRNVKGPHSALLMCVTTSVTGGRTWRDMARGEFGVLPVGFARPYRGVRTRTHTYVRDRTGPWFLYCNESDPYQIDNRIAGQGAATVPPELERELDGWLERTGDFFGDNSDYIRHIDLGSGRVLAPEGLRISG